MKKKYIKIKESDIQIGYVQWASLQPWFYSLISIPNEFPLHALPVHLKKKYLFKRLKMGLKKGASDLFLAYPVGIYHGAFIEVKAPGKKLRKEQEQFLEKRAMDGYYQFFADSIDGLVKKTKEYLASAK